MDNMDNLFEWLTEIQDFKQADWDKLPDIGLYMDQVQTYIERQITAFTKPEKDKLLTPAMINNYIKDDLIPRAESKKYSNSHVALLIMIATLKQVLSMQDLKALLADRRQPEQVKEVYDHYLLHQQQDMSEISKVVSERLAAELKGDDDMEMLRMAALELSIEARNRILMSERILSSLAQQLIKKDSVKKEKQHKE